MGRRVYSKNLEQEVVLFVSDPSNKHLLDSEIATKFGLSNIKLHRIKKAAGLAGVGRGRRKRSTTTVSSPVHVPISEQLTNEEKCEVRNATLLGSQLHEISRELRLPVDLIRREYNHAIMELREGSIKPSQEYYHENGIISKRQAVIPQPALKPTPVPQLASTASNPFVDMVRQQYKPQMQEAIRQVMAETMAEILNR